MEDINQFISIIIPVFNESESIAYLLEEVNQVEERITLKDVEWVRQNP